MEHPVSITHFLTDASLLSLCSALAAISRAKVTVHNEGGSRIVYAPGDPPWTLADSDHDSRIIAEAMHAMGRNPGVIPHDGRLLEPLVVAGRTIGAIVIEADPLRVSSADLDRLRDIVAKLACTINEFCEHDVLLQHRNAELSVLFRLSSLLVGARDLDAVLNVALRSGIEILNADAGMIHLLGDDGGLVLRAHANLGEQFIKVSATNPPEGAALRELLSAEGLDGVTSGSLRFSGRNLGQMRLFWKKPVFLEPAEQSLVQTIIEQVAAAVAGARLIQSESRARAVQRQLKLAADVQRRMLPRSIPSHPRLDIDARYIPSMDLGGDFYDLIELNGHLGLLIGDVAGKGVPAALLMAAVRASLRAHATDVYHINDIIARVNKDMARDTLPNEFATLFYGVIDPLTLRLTYCNAGHDPPLILRPAPGRDPQDQDLHELTAGGMVVGVDPSQVYHRGMFDFAPRDTFIAYTDGIVDARNFENQRFGRPRLRRAILDFIRTNPEASAKALADHIVWEVRRFIGLHQQADDETLMVIRVKG